MAMLLLQPGFGLSLRFQDRLVPHLVAIIDGYKIERYLKFGIASVIFICSSLGSS